MLILLGSLSSLCKQVARSISLTLHGAFDREVACLADEIYGGILPHGQLEKLDLQLGNVLQSGECIVGCFLCLLVLLDSGSLDR